MKVLNCMLSKNFGGIEQAFLDYNKALKLNNSEVISVCHSKSPLAINPDFIKLNSFASWDLIASYKLRNIIKKHQIDIAIAHGNRPISLLRRATKNLIPLVGLAHNYSIKYLKTCDYIITVTKALQKYIIEQGYNPQKIIHIPNMITLPNFNPKTELSSPLVIGSMGRFVAKKALDLIIKAVHLLKQQNIIVKATIGGGGEEETRLKQLTTELGVEDQVLFPGWIKDKEKFYKEIDFFILPSHHEPFGIVMLESMANSIPIISSASEGPLEVITNQETGIIFNKNNPYELAENIKLLMTNAKLRISITNNAYKLIENNFSLPIVARRINEFLDRIYHKEI